MLRQIPWTTRPYMIDEPTATAIAEGAAQSTVTCLAGSVPSLLQLMAEAKRLSPRRANGGVARSDGGPLVAQTNRSAGVATPRGSRQRRVVLLEMASRFGSPIAVEDPESGLLRWLPDHGVYFEFIPAEQVNEPQPERRTFDHVEPGAEYELVMTSPAGLWACRTGEMVRFERRDPPLFRFVPSQIADRRLQIAEVQSAICNLQSAIPKPHVTQGPHPRSGGIPVEPPKMFVHSPWSVPADRG